jgi:hypothetical protein
MKFFQSSKSQAEIFGIALFFVILIIGVIVFTQVKALNPDDKLSEITDDKFRILSESSINSILGVSTGCEIFRGRDSLQDMITYCIDYSFTEPDPPITCSHGTFGACTHSQKVLNDTIKSVFGVNGTIGHIPYQMAIFSDEADFSVYKSLNFTNMKDYKGVDLLTNREYANRGFKKAPPGLKILPTSQRGFTFELYLYHR